MPSVGLEPMIPAFETAKTVHALDRAATVIGNPLHQYYPQLQISFCEVYIIRSCRYTKPRTAEDKWEFRCKARYLKPTAGEKMLKRDCCAGVNRNIFNMTSSSHFF
jgi:hypothetical protein